MTRVQAEVVAIGDAWEVTVCGSVLETGLTHNEAWRVADRYNREPKSIREEVVDNFHLRNGRRFEN